MITLKFEKISYDSFSCLRVRWQKHKKKNLDPNQQTSNEMIRFCIAALLIAPTIPIPPDWNETVGNSRRLFIRVAPFYRFHPLDAFNRYIACVDATQDGCDDNNKIEFVGSEVDSPASNQLRYHDSGPTELQGLFWLKGLPLGDSLLTSMARTRQAPGGIANGETDRFDKLGYVAVLRPRGDHNWAFSGDSEVGSSAINSQLDVVYGLDLIKGMVFVVNRSSVLIMCISCYFPFKEH